MTSSSPVAPDFARDDSSGRAAAAWIAPMARAIPALVAAIVITFTADHSAVLGFLAFGGFAIATGSVGAVRAISFGRGTASRGAFVVSAAITVAAGIVALALRDENAGVFVSILSIWAIATGAIELSVGIGVRRTRAEARDWRFVGVITILLGAVALAVPAGFAQRFTGPDDVARTLTASVIVVGAFGAYAAILGVFEIIAALSLKWGPGHKSHGDDRLAENGASR